MALKAGITGGAGYVGSKLAVRLREEGCEVRIIDNFSYSSKEAMGDLQEIGVEIIEGDILMHKKPGYPFEEHDLGK